MGGAMFTMEEDALLIKLKRDGLTWQDIHTRFSKEIPGLGAVIDGKDSKYYRQPIRTFDFTELDGKDK